MGNKRLQESGWACWNRRLEREGKLVSFEEKQEG